MEGQTTTGFKNNWWPPKYSVRRHWKNAALHKRIHSSTTTNRTSKASQAHAQIGYLYTQSDNHEREQELTNIAKNAMEILQANRICTQTSPYPLAIADIQGNMRSTQKSKFLETLTQCLHFDQAVTDVCPLLSQPPQDLCVIIDMLYYIYMPPPPNVTTYNEFFTHLWNQRVGKFVFQHGAAHVIIVLDKPDFLPPPRSIVHTKRARSAQDTKVDPTVAPDEHIPHSRTYSSLLSASQTFKSNLLEFITTQIINKAATVSLRFNFSLIMDSPSLPVVQTIQNGNTHDSPSNEHGEADYAVWHHCIHTSSNNVLIVSLDTDTWVYGLGLCELKENECTYRGEIQTVTSTSMKVHHSYPNCHQWHTPYFL